MVAGKQLTIFGQLIIGGNMTDVKPKKSLGQHWLDDQVSLKAICDAAEVSDGDQVLEIGPGKGSLTGALMQRGANIFAVEFDTEAVSYLEKVFARQLDVCFHIELGDIRSFNLNRLPTNYKVVANIPYYLTSHLIQILSESANPPSAAVLLVQKEVAERVCADRGDMSILSVTAQFFWEVKLGLVVPAKLFTPPPKVDSQVLILKRRELPLFDVDSKQFFRVVKSGFSAKRKTILNSLSAGLRLDKEQISDILAKSNICPNQRAQELSLQDWFELYRFVKPILGA